MTFEELVDKLIDMGYNREKAEKIAKSRNAFRRQLASDGGSSSGSVEAQQDFSAMHESIISRINKFTGDT